jgi:hypothetical protein
MSTLTAEKAVREAVDRTTGFKYVLMLMGRNVYLHETIATEDVTGAMEDLATGLRSWLLAYMRNGSRDNGWYTGCLVATDEDGSYDTYLSLAVEDAIWYWDEECAPLSRLTK